MPMCGFNENMLRGIESLNSGLFDAIVKKAEEKDIKLERAVEEELSELGEFIRELGNLNDSIEQERLLGLARYTRAFYLGTLQKYRGEKDISDSMRKEGKEAQDFLYRVDRIYEEKFKDRKEGMKDLIKFLNKREIIL